MEKGLSTELQPLVDKTTIFKGHQNRLVTKLGERLTEGFEIMY